MMGIDFMPFVRKLDKKGKLVDVSPPPPPLFTPEHEAPEGGEDRGGDDRGDEPRRARRDDEDARTLLS